MTAPLDDVAEACGADPADVRALLATYPEDVVDLWEEQDVLSTVGVAEVHRVMNPLGCRTHCNMYDPATGYRPAEHWSRF